MVNGSRDKWSIAYVYKIRSKPFGLSRFTIANYVRNEVLFPSDPEGLLMDVQLMASISVRANKVQLWNCQSNSGKNRKNSLSQITKVLPTTAA